MSEHQHCWHADAGMVMPLGMRGQIFGQVCCWCGAHRTVTESWASDPKHGPHSPDRVATYEYSEPRPLTPSSRTATEPETP